MKESAGGKLLMLTLPLVMVAPGITTITALPLWFSLLAYGTLALAEVGAVCFFFPDQTVGRIHTYRMYRYALRSGFLRAEDVRHLLHRRANRRGTTVQHDDWNLVGIVPSLAAQNPAYGALTVTWIRSRHDLSLLVDALTIPLAPNVLAAHLDTSKPLNPQTVATMAALHRDPMRDTRNDPPYWKLDTIMGMAGATNRIGPAPLPPTPHCACGITHSA